MKVLLFVTLYFLSVIAGPNIKTVEKCTAINCKLKNNCRCSSTDNPVIDAPQLVAITFNEVISQANYATYWKRLFFDKTNHDGSPVGLTFYVPHEFTDYALVNDLYGRGYEIGVYSITKNSNLTYWETASQTDLEDEFGGQKTIISTFANIPSSHIKGVRTPFLKLNGDVSINAYQSSGFTYDSSWSTSLKLLPYTLNYKSSQICNTGKCLKESHPNFWITPLISLRGMDNKECDYFSSCNVEGSAVEISNWLYSKIRNANRAPMILLLDIKWFQSVENSFDGFSLFLDKIKSAEDVFLVTVQDILKWVQNPVSVEEYKVPVRNGRKTKCVDVLCPLKEGEGGKKYMKSCVPCPEVYPWKGNPKGKAQ